MRRYCGRPPGGVRLSRCMFHMAGLRGTNGHEMVQRGILVFQPLRDFSRGVFTARRARQAHIASLVWFPSVPLRPRQRHLSLMQCRCLQAPCSFLRIRLSLMSSGSHPWRPSAPCLPGVRPVPLGKPPQGRLGTLSLCVGFPQASEGVGLSADTRHDGLGR